MIYREKQKALRSIRTFEKRLREVTATAEEADKAVLSYREQVGKKKDKFISSEK